MQFPFLFSPIEVNGMRLANRIVMTAMHLGYTPDGRVTDRLVDFYVRRAEGGAGLIVVGGCPVDEYGGMRGMIGLHDDRFIPGLKKLTAAVSAAGARIGAQLYQAGRYTHSSMIGGEKPFSASAVRSRFTGETPRALELTEIPGVQDRFAEAASRAREAGFDAVEILASAGYLISQFLSPVTNLRTDQYGGSLENRMRFGVEVARKVRAAVGPDFPVLVRVAGNDFMEGGHTNREARAFAAALEQAGVDLLNVTGGWHETRVPQLTMGVPRGAYAYLARGIKSAVSIPVLASNRINDPRVGEEILRSGAADLVTVARGLIADPDFPKKAAEGRADRIYHCIACNQGCFDSIFQFKPVMCLVNPAAGREGDPGYRAAPAGRPRKVLVVGGGPGGMKAACTAAERGHRVTLVEKENVLGGQLRLNAFVPGRKEMVTAADDLARNLAELDVTVITGKEADLPFVREIAPEVVVIATGAVPVVPRIPGVDGDNVVQAWEVLAGRAAVGGKAAVVGGNAVGLETALHLAHQGTLSPDALHFLMVNRAESLETLLHLLNRGTRKVTVVEMTPKAGKDLGLTTRWTLMAEMKRLGVSIMTKTEAVGIRPDGLEIRREGETTFLPADTVVLAAGSRSENRLADEIAGIVPEIYTVGDAGTPRKALDAIREGYLAGLKI